jgi:hypothetical protein
MDPGERTTGTRDEQYNLIAVLYHALHGAENCEIYAADAEVAGRDELAAFFLEAQAEQIELADRAKELLGIGGAVPGAAGGATVGAGIAPEDGPPTTDVPPPPLRGEPGDVDRGISPEPSPGTAGVTSGRVTPPTDVPPETPGGVPPETSARDVPPRTADVPRMEGAATVESDIPPDTAPGDIPPRSADVQQEAQVRADQVSVPTERPVGEAPPQVGDDLRTETTTPPDTAPPAREDVSPETPRTEGVPRAGEEPPEAERGATTSGREYFSDLIRETGRRSRGEI